VQCDEVARELAALAGNVSVAAPVRRPLLSAAAATDAGLELLVTLPLYAVDGLVRRAGALQQMPQRADEWVRVAPATLAQLGLSDGASVTLTADGQGAASQILADARVPAGVVWVKATSRLAQQLPAATRLGVSAATSGVTA